MENIKRLKLLNTRMQYLSDMISDLNQKYSKLEKERYEVMTELSKKRQSACV